MTGRREALGRRVLRLIPALRRSLDQVPDYARQWTDANTRALAADGPL